MITIKPLPEGMTMKDPSALIATGFGSGRLYPAPGTWGTIAGMAIALPFAKLVLLFAIVVAVLFGTRAVETFEEKSGEHDLSMIVIDEWVGIWIAMLAAKPQIDDLALAFIAFRAFDVVKPWPISWMDKNLGGAVGVMADDIAAGLLAAACVYQYGVLMP